MVRYIIVCAAVFAITTNAYSVRRKITFLEAVVQNESAAVAQHLKRGASVNTKDLFGEVPLYYACMNGNILIISQLLAHQADANTENSRGSRPVYALLDRLGFHKETHEASIIRMLKRAGADLNVRSYCDDGTPLHRCASRLASKRITLALLGSGADPEIMSEKRGVTPIQLAREWLEHHIVSYKNAGPKRQSMYEYPPEILCAEFEKLLTQVPHYKALQKAIQENDYASLMSYAQKAPDLIRDWSDEYERKTVHFIAMHATKKSAEKLIPYLVSQLEIPDFEKNTPVMLAERNKNQPVVDYLKECIDNINNLTKSYENFERAVVLYSVH